MRRLTAATAAPAVNKRAKRTLQRHIVAFKSALLEHAGEIGHDDVERAIEFAFLPT